MRRPRLFPATRLVLTVTLSAWACAGQPPPESAPDSGVETASSHRLEAARTPEEATRLEEETRAAIRAAEGLLEEVRGGLAADDRREVDLVERLVADSREALRSGELERAANLAEKARRLAEDLGEP